MIPSLVPITSGTSMAIATRSVYTTSRCADETESAPLFGIGKPKSPPLTLANFLGVNLPSPIVAISANKDSRTEGIVKLTVSIALYCKSNGNASPLIIMRFPVRRKETKVTATDAACIFAANLPSIVASTAADHSERTDSVLITVVTALHSKFYGKASPLTSIHFICSAQRNRGHRY